MSDRLIPRSRDVRLTPVRRGGPDGCPDAKLGMSGRLNRGIRLSARSVSEGLSALDFRSIESTSESSDSPASRGNPMSDIINQPAAKRHETNLEASQ